MEQYSVIKKNEIMPFATTWMDRETVILSEVKAEKDNTIWYHSYVESKKNDICELIYKTDTDSQTYRTSSLLPKEKGVGER